ncbi:MAG: hypothetical protein ACI9EX_000257 [Oleispira sp.]|jgi:hypothetical protein
MGVYDAEIKTLGANNPNIMDYIGSSAIDDTVKVVHKF